MRPFTNGSVNSLPYDSLEMLLAFHISEKARAKLEQYIVRFPEHSVKLKSEAIPSNMR